MIVINVLVVSHRMVAVRIDNSCRELRYQEPDVRPTRGLSTRHLKEAVPAAHRASYVHSSCAADEPWR